MNTNTMYTANGQKRMETSLKGLMCRVVFNKIFYVFIAIICVTQFSLVKAQEITEENYRKVDNAIWTQLEKEFKPLRMHHNKKVYAIAEQKNIEAAIKYASVPSGLQRLFMVRLNVSKDTIRTILKNLPNDMQSSPYAKSLLYQQHQLAF